MTSMRDQLRDFTRGEKTCPIWGTECQEKIQDADSITVVASPRAGGDYVIDRSAFSELRRMYAANPGNEFANMLRARLTTILVKQRQLGNNLPRITASILDAARSAGPARMEDKAMRLLQLLAELQSRSIATPVAIGRHRPDVRVRQLAEPWDWDKAQQNMEMACAHAEVPWVGYPIDLQELAVLTTHLADRGFIKKGKVTTIEEVEYHAGPFGFLCHVTTSGYIAVEQLQTERKSDQCFVALWFDEKTNALYDNAIVPAVEAAGYKAVRIDRQTDFIGKIDDQIIAEIRRSRFVIADFTHNERGARGSVYYEAGFAHGLDIPVIFTCRADQICKLAFDTNHFLHLAWPADAPEALIEPLKNRITANIGAGPYAAGAIPQAG